MTGGAGFIGSHVVDRLLADGHSVCVVDDLSTGSASNVPPTAQFHQVDICDGAALRDVFAGFRPEVVFHAAAQMDVRQSARAPEFDARVNVLGGLNVLREGVAVGARRFVYASTAAVYGTCDHLPVSETAPTGPISEYGASKLAFEHYLGVYAGRGLIESAVLRYANVYGPRQRSDGEAGVVAIFTGRMLRSEPVTIFGDGTKTRDYVYVSDVVEATVRAASGPAVVVANVSSGREVSDRELFREVAAATRYAGEPTHAADRPGDVARSCLDPAVARRTWGWSATVALRDGLRRVVEWASAVGLAALLTLGVGRAASAQVPPPPERLAARQWFQDAKFGLFIHWGVYSALGQGEWVMQQRKIAVGDYEWLASTFNPTKFDARAWVALAQRAGVRYITITSRHHDGFSMFKTAQTPYNIVDWTPYGRDPLKALADASHAAGIKLFFYYSQLDWHHPDYWPRGRTGHDTGRPNGGDWTRYLAFMDAQLTELLSNYGPLGGIWFDGMWDKPDADWQLDSTYALIHRLQPAALIIPNHHERPRPGEDVQTFEQDLPGANTAGFNTTSISDALPLETSLTINDSWGFNITDKQFKSLRTLVGYLVRAAGSNANLLLNIGPRPDGTISPELSARLDSIGDWLRIYGSSIYDTRGGPVPPRAWGATTRRGDTVFVHVLDWPDRSLALPLAPGSVGGARLLRSGRPVPIREVGGGLVVTLPPRDPDEPDEIDTVIMLVPRRR